MKKRISVLVIFLLATFIRTSAAVKNTYQLEQERLDAEIAAEQVSKQAVAERFAWPFTNQPPGLVLSNTASLEFWFAEHRRSIREARKEKASKHGQPNPDYEPNKVSREEMEELARDLAGRQFENLADYVKTVTSEEVVPCFYLCTQKKWETLVESQMPDNIRAEYQARIALIKNQAAIDEETKRSKTFTDKYPQKAVLDIDPGASNVRPHYLDDADHPPGWGTWNDCADREELRAVLYDPLVRLIRHQRRMGKPLPPSDSI